jgi:hypothetical protein
MKCIKILVISVLALLLAASTVTAGDFDWTRNFNRQANTNPQEFKTRMAVRFHLSDMQVIALRNIFASPADAYIMLRLGEIRGDLKTISKEQAIEAVNTYRSNRSKGWDILAGILGIETGAPAYIALKREHDLYDGSDRDQVAYQGYGQSKDNL